ncbi:hypothetical protein [Pedobacter sp. P26]|uniref:hypothetical protein n=1 Tax=Pedobacter sp. P26 TaxID=3423956 RepID=UPI003D67C6A7
MSYIRNGYGDQASNQYSLIYLDKLGLSLGSYEVVLYPMINYNYNLNRSLSFATNAAIKKVFFRTWDRSGFKPMTFLILPNS